MGRKQARSRVEDAQRASQSSMQRLWPEGDALQEAIFVDAEQGVAGAPAQLNLNRFIGNASIFLPESAALRPGRPLWIDVVAEVTDWSADTIEPRRFTIRHGFVLSEAESHGVTVHANRFMLESLGRAGFIEIQAFVGDSWTKPAVPQSCSRYLFVNHPQDDLELILPQAHGDEIDLEKLDRRVGSPLPYMRVAAEIDGPANSEGWLESFTPGGHTFGKLHTGQVDAFPVFLTDGDVGQRMAVYCHTIHPRIPGQRASVSRCRTLSVVRRAKEP